jgi:cytochrome c556
MNRLTKLSLITWCALAGSATALAEEPAPSNPRAPAEQATLLRQGLLKAVGWAFTGHVGPMLRHKTPFDAAVVQTSALRVRELAEMLPEAFQYDTRSFQVKTRARESIWTRPGDFATKADDLRKAALAMEDAARSGDKDKTIAAAVAVGKACSACHDSYKDS